MTLQEACRILGIPPGTEKKEINSAYEILMKAEIACDDEKTHDGKRRAAKEKKNTVWDAPINVNAFVEREVLQYVEDHDGTVLGNYCIVKGKYLWKTDEDFPLFLLSLYKCSKELLDGADERPHLDEIPLKCQQVQVGKELGYLSFFDDRMYYIVIPLFEQKRVQVKFRIAEVNTEKRRKGTIILNYSRQYKHAYNLL